MAVPTTKLEQLQAIPKLRKLHAGFAPSGTTLPLGDPITNEVVRITGAVPISTHYVDYPNAVSEAKTLADQNNAIVVFNASPMHQFREPEHIAEVKNLDAPTNPAVNRELDFLRDRCIAVEAGMGGVAPPVVLLDTERYPIYGKSAQERENLQERYDLTYSIPKSIFGAETKVWWFGFQPNHINNGDRWSEDGATHGVGEQTEGTSISHYNPTSLLDLYENIYHTTSWVGYQDKKCSPWLSLGCGFNRANIEANNPYLWHADFNYELAYDYYYSWWAGRILNQPNAHGDRYAKPLSQVEMVCFWPGALDPRVPKWLDHFIAYCHGATGVWQNWTPLGV